MTNVRLRTVDSFTDRPFTGNPAAVLVLDEAPSDEWMAAVARETNLSETGFVIREQVPDADFRLRWFTPTVEIDLCGHATLASAHCLYEDGMQGPIRFATRSGILTVAQRPDGLLAMDFPAWPPAQFEARSAVAKAIGVPVEWTGRTDNESFLLALITDEGSVRDLRADLAAVGRLDASVGLIVTAAADPEHGYDFVSRVFAAPQAAVREDPVTGSAHTVLAPYWADRLGRTSLVGLQVSSRSGLVGVELNGDRVTITGRAITVFDGTLSSAAIRGSRVRIEAPATVAIALPMGGQEHPAQLPELPNSCSQHSGQNTNVPGLGVAPHPPQAISGDELAPVRVKFG